ncbi:MAG TPA: PASTA domain-containing protein [Bacteroidota bacterium]|nr:PASTA domain-containing protein [Bacteroidota bacterium]
MAENPRQILLRKIRAVLGRKLVLYPLGFIVFLLLLNYIILPFIVKHGKTLSVPAVVGIPVDSAKLTLSGNGLVAVEAETRPDPDYPAGTVTSQNPVPGSIVKQGRHVYLTISGGEGQVFVPSLRGRTLRDARFALERYGLRMGGVSFATSPTFPENTIIDQTVAQNTRVQRGAEVGVVVSMGTDSLQIVVPQVTGKSTTEAERILMAAGLKIGNVTLQPNFDLLPNSVVDQFPRAGERAARGQAVDLFVVQAGSRPTEEIQPPR